MNNNNFYPTGGYPNRNTVLVPQQGTTPSQNAPLEATLTPLTTRAEYADNIFYLNIGREVEVYFSYPDSIEWRDKTFRGTIIDAGRDYLLIKDKDGKTILLWLIYINYAIFDGNIIHNFPRPTNPQQ